MDIFAHGIWGVALGKGINKKKKKKLKLSAILFWSIFPDLYAFTIPFIWVFFNIAFGSLTISELPSPHSHNESVALSNSPIFNLASSLYNVSHSLVFFGFCFLFAWALKAFFLNKDFNIFKVAPMYEMSGWLLHILIDIPTHKAEFYPTPVFWPFFDWHFKGGITWGTWQFQVINYSLMLVVFLLLIRKNKKNG